MTDQLCDAGRRAGALFLALLFVPAFAAAPVTFAQDMMDHAHHDMNMEMGDSLMWRMPPMDMSMPMMPGMDGQVPVVGPFLPGEGMDLSMFETARPMEVVEMADGDTLHLEASLVRRSIGGQEFVMMGYNKMYPGPMIRAEKDAEVLVEFTNNIEMPTTVHWHGLRLDNAFDGVPFVTQDPVDNGESFTYELKFPDTGMYWYHPHMREDVQQDLGLYGNMLVDPREENFYAPANREATLILDDILMDRNGLIPFGESAPTHALMGRFGNIMLTNGVTDYRMEAKAGEVVRFYLTNVANSRTFNVVFDGAPIKIIADDVSKYERERMVGSVVIAPAERYIVDVYFPESREYTITNTIQAINHFRGEFYPHVDTLGTVAVADERAADDFEAQFREERVNEDVVSDIDDFRQYFDKEPDHNLRLTVRVNDLPLSIVRMMEIDTLYVPPMEWNDAMPMMNWLSSGEQVEWILEDTDTGKESMNIDWAFETGDVVKIRVFNDPDTFHPMNHPFHIHGQRFVITHIDGVPNTNMAWKDTAIVPVGSTMDFLVDMSNPGEWMAHCHIAEHLHSGMMLGFTVGETVAP